MIVVTGGLGFIGNELVRQLVKGDERVVVIDNRNRIAKDIEDLAEVEVVDIDVTDYDKLSKYFHSVKPTTIFHLAAIHFIPECNDNPERTLRVNVEGTQALLRAAAENGVLKFLFASSGAVYDDLAEPLTELSPVAPADIYALSKWFGEQLCLKYSRESDLRIMVCRLFNNYGPRETNPHIVPEILNQLRSENVLRLGNIKPIRDYIYTADCAKALIKIKEFATGKYEVVNVATGNGKSVEQLIEMIGEIMGRKLVVETDQSRFRKVDKMVQLANIDKLKNLTKWEPEMTIQAGLHHLLKYEKLI